MYSTSPPPTLSPLIHFFLVISGNHIGQPIKSIPHLDSINSLLLRILGIHICQPIKSVPHLDSINSLLLRILGIHIGQPIKSIPHLDSINSLLLRISGIHIGQPIKSIPHLDSINSLLINSEFQEFTLVNQSNQSPILTPLIHFLCPQLRRSLGGILVWACPTVSVLHLHSVKNC